MPGPLPKPNARRRRTPPWDATRRLPAGGYDGPIPKYPLGRLTRARTAGWRELWRRPQAAA